MSQVNTIIADEAETSPEVPESFRVHDPQTANWVVRKITEARQYADRVRSWAAAEIRRAERDEQFFIHRFGRDLEEWCRGQLADGRSRSVNLPAARIGFRMSRTTLGIQDEAALLEWCRRNLPNAIEIAEHLAKAQIRNHFEMTGELPAGAVLQPACDRFYVERSRRDDEAAERQPSSL